MLIDSSTMLLGIDCNNRIFSILIFMNFDRILLYNYFLLLFEKMKINGDENDEKKPSFLKAMAFVNYLPALRSLLGPMRSLCLILNKHSQE
jgi:hypothetical protein